MTLDYALFKKHWLVAAPSDTLKSAPLARTLLETPVVLFRDEHQRAVALLDRCPHRNAPLSQGKIKNNCLVCPYHGWQFTPQGDCKSIPGLTRPHGAKIPSIPRFHVLEKNGLIWVKLDQNQAGSSPYVPFYLNDPRYHSFIWSMEIQGSLIHILENFLDGTHTPFVHGGLIRTDAHRQEITAHMVCTQERVEVRYSGENKQSGWISRLFENSRGESFGRFIMPCVAEIEYRSKDGSTSFAITAYVTPLSQERHAIHAVITFRKKWLPAKLSRWLLTPFLKAALKQDMDILAKQRENIQRFGKENVISTELDFFRSSLEKLISGGKNCFLEKKIKIRL